MYVRGYLQGSENGRVVTIVLEVPGCTGNVCMTFYDKELSFLLITLW